MSPSPAPSPAPTRAHAPAQQEPTPHTASTVSSYLQDTSNSSPSSSTRKDTPDRSRTGCVQCRTCSEERPTCSRCAQRRVGCTYDREVGVRHRNKRRRPLDLKSERERDQSTPTSQYRNEHELGGIPHSFGIDRTVSPRAQPYSPYPSTTSYGARNPREQDMDILPQRPSFISTTSAVRQDDPTALLSPSAELRSWIEGGTSIPIDIPAAVPSAVTDYGIGNVDLPNTNDPASSGFNIDQMLVEHLLQEFFSTSSSDISDLFPSLLNATTSDQSPCINYNSSKFVTDPATVRRRLEQSQQPPACWPISCYVPASFPNSATKEELDLVRHFIEIQSPMSIAAESEHNPLRKHVLPVALKITPTATGTTTPSETEHTSTPGTKGDHSANTNTPERDNPAFYALLAAAATHRANLFVAAGKEEDPSLRRTASQSRAKAYSLAADGMDAYPSAVKDKREQIDCAMLLLTYTAVLDGNSKLLPILYESYHHALSLTDYSILSSRSRAFVTMCAMYGMWYEFPTLATSCQSLRPLLELVPPSERFAEPNLDGLFGVPGSICIKWLETIDLVRKYQRAKMSGNPSTLISICLQAEELDEDIASEQKTLLSSSVSPYGSAGSADRVRQGVEVHYATLRVFVQKEILGIRTEEDRIQRQIKMALGTLSTIRWGTETGLLIPLFVLAINALGTDRELFRAFLSRCCWKGSAGPRTVAAAVQEIWDRLNRGLGDDWRGVLLKYGGPILI
ncbi:hypothetical protein IAT40_004170 [Kwoniella sp. CBS 6097]